jgi:hypothetical protein
MGWVSIELLRISFTARSLCSAFQHHTSEKLSLPCLQFRVEIPRHPTGAAGNGHETMIRLLIKKRTGVNTVEKTYWTTLHRTDPEWARGGGAAAG